MQSALPRQRRRWLRWFKYLFLAIVATVATLACAGAIYQGIESHRDQARFHAPGQLVDVGGHRLHIDCTGSGAPTVILEAGGGNPALSWYKVQPQVAGFSQVCSYDRAGYGWSDPGTKAPTAIEIATELHALLSKAGIAGPYVLVGHSIGGVYVREFQSLYPSEVVGLVLVDSSHPEQMQRFPPEATKQSALAGKLITVMEWLRPFGVTRWLIGRAAPPDIRDEYGALVSRPTFLPAVKAETETLNESLAEGRSLGSLGDLPLAVLSHDPSKVHFGKNLDEPINQAWDEMQTELSHLSSRGTHQVVQGASHDIELDAPDVVAGAIRNVVAQARAK